MKEIIRIKYSEPEPSWNWFTLSIAFLLTMLFGVIAVLTYDSVSKVKRCECVHASEKK